MTIHQIDNSDADAFGKTILWQYDKAANLNRIISFFKEFYDVSVKEFWDSYPERFIGIDTADIGLATWGELIGEPRPYYYDSEEDKVKNVSDDMYRRVLKAIFFLMKSSGSSNDIVEYVRMIFRCESDHSKSGVLVKDLGSMAMEYTANNVEDSAIGKTPFSDMTAEAQMLFETATSTNQNLLDNRLLDSARDLLPFPAGVRYNTKPDEVVFGFSGQEPTQGTGQGDSYYEELNATYLTTDESELPVTIGTWNLGSSSDPKTGGLCELDSEGSFTDTTFISNDTLLNFETGA